MRISKIRKKGKLTFGNRLAFEIIVFVRSVNPTSMTVLCFPGGVVPPSSLAAPVILAQCYLLASEEAALNPPKETEMQDFTLSRISNCVHVGSECLHLELYISTCTFIHNMVLSR